MSQRSKNIVPAYLTELARKHRTPAAVQKWLHTVKYNQNQTVYSAQEVIKRNSAHCLEGAFAAALIMEQHGYPPLVMSFESIDDLEHVVYIFKDGDYWGAIGQSRDAGLHGRMPRFKTLRGLAWSYFDPYIDDFGRITAYQIANLNDLGVDWRYSSKNLWLADKYLVDLPHRELRSSDRRYERLKKRHQEKGPLLDGPFWW